MTRTGNYRFETRYTQRRWFTSPRAVQVLMVEVEGPTDSVMTWGRWWKEANRSDVNAYEQGRITMRVDLALAQDRVKRYQDRLENIHDLASLA